MTRSSRSQQLAFCEPHISIFLSSCVCLHSAASWTSDLCYKHSNLLPGSSIFFQVASLISLPFFLLLSPFLLRVCCVQAQNDKSWNWWLRCTLGCVNSPWHLADEHLESDILDKRKMKPPSLGKGARKEKQRRHISKAFSHFWTESIILVCSFALSLASLLNLASATFLLLADSSSPELACCGSQHLKP